MAAGKLLGCSYVIFSTLPPDAELPHWPRFDRGQAELADSSFVLSDTCVTNQRLVQHQLQL